MASKVHELMHDMARQRGKALVLALPARSSFKLTLLLNQLSSLLAHSQVETHGAFGRITPLMLRCKLAGNGTLDAIQTSIDQQIGKMRFGSRQLASHLSNV